MGKKFEKGERVAVYGVIMMNGVADGSADTRRVSIVQVDHGKYLQLVDGCCNAKQARRIKRRREWWANVYDMGEPSVHSTKEKADRSASSDRLECILVREVVRK